MMGGLELPNEDLIKGLANSVVVAILTGVVTSQITIASLTTEMEWIKSTLHKHEGKIEQLDWLRTPEGIRIMQNRMKR